MSVWKYGCLFQQAQHMDRCALLPHNKRWCINLIPCFTFWITKPGGNTP